MSEFSPYFKQIVGRDESQLQPLKMCTISACNFIRGLYNAPTVREVIVTQEVCFKTGKFRFYLDGRAALH